MLYSWNLFSCLLWNTHRIFSCVHHFSCVQLFVTPWIVAHHGLSQARILGCHFLLQVIFPTQVSNSLILCLLHQQAGSLPAEPSGKPHPWDILWLSHTVLFTSSLDLGSVFWKEKGQGSTIRCRKLSEVGGQVKSSLSHLLVLSFEHLLVLCPFSVLMVSSAWAQICFYASYSQASRLDTTF